MRIYAQKGHILSEPERLELGRLLLKAGYITMMGKERQGNMTQHYVEFYRKVELTEQKKTADEAGTFTDGRGNNTMATITQEGGFVNA